MGAAGRVSPGKVLVLLLFRAQSIGSGVFSRAATRLIKTKGARLILGFVLVLRTRSLGRIVLSARAFSLQPHDQTDLSSQFTGVIQRADSAADTGQIGHKHGRRWMLTYICPATKQAVETSLNTSNENLQRLGQAKLSLWCPYCQNGHQIIACDAFVMERGAGR
jgi:hypothetical protein